MEVRRVRFRSRDPGRPSMIQLWPHQQQSIDLLRKALASGKRKPMLQVPTGGGKTRTAGAIVELMRQRDKRAVFIVDAISLIDKTVQSFYDLGRSEERRVGKECVRTGDFRWSPYH